MPLATLVFSGWGWLWPAAIALLGALVLLAWGYRAAPQPVLRLIAPLLKLLGVAALAFCLLEPLWSGQRARPGANLFAVVADNSRGLQIRDAGALQSRGEELRQLLDAGGPTWQATLAENFDLRRYHFDTRLEASRDFTDLDFEGRASAIGSALKTLATRFQGRPLAGVLLLTDGNATDIRNQLPDLTGLPPVYPVVLGRRGATCDLSVAQVAVTQTAFEDAPVVVQADIGAAGYQGEDVQVQLLDRQGQPVDEQKVRVRNEDGTVGARFQFRPEKPGLSFYELRVGGRSELEPGTNTTSPTEATLANNSRVVVVDREQGPYRVLYVGGRPNWEYKFLNRAVQADKEVELVALVRVARREPKFEFRGRAGETSNPLFRGFGEQSPEEIERYDQPVLVRLNTRDDLELRSGFPRTPEDLFGYHAVILDDIESAFFRPDQAAVLQRFVSERGGAVLMLGGMESFREGGYHRTPIGDMLPVYLDRAEAPNTVVPLHFDLAREGWLLPWARVRDNESGERQRLEDMPPFLVANRVREAKPGAAVVATARDADRSEVPALAVQRFGRGRTAAFLIGDFWRWGMRSPEAREDMEKSWRQLVRWLVSDVPKRVEIAAEPVPEDPNGAVRLQVRVRDSQFQPMDNASVSVEIEPVVVGTAAPAPAPAAPSDTPTNAVPNLVLKAEAATAEPGLYEATYVPRITGGFRASARVLNAQGAEHGRAETGWSSDPAAEEFRSLVPNVALLEELARKTGGEVIEASRLESFASDLPTRNAPVMEAWTYPAWHTPALFGFALACLVTEWGLRRWKGLP